MTTGTPKQGRDDRNGVDADIGPDEDAGLIHVNSGGTSPFLLTGDHAGAEIPRALGTLGLAAPDRARHIALDIGVAALGRVLADRLDAVFLGQRYSRLVVDCNRDPASPDAMPAISDATPIPGNQALDAAARAARIAAIHTPYHAALAAEIDRRATPPILIALHSFTPRLADGAERPWAIGVLHGGGNDFFARALLARLQARRHRVVGDNQPYRMDSTDYSVPRHAFPRGLAYAEIEIRQDLLENRAAYWSAVLGEALVEALAAC